MMVAAAECRMVRGLQRVSNRGGGAIGQSLTLSILGSGSAGNCTYLGSSEGGILLDMGFSCRETLRRLALLGVGPEEILAIIVTHEHIDHVRGLRVFSRKYHTPLHLTRETGLAMNTILQEYEGPVLTIEAEDEFTVGPFRVRPFPVSHDAADPIGMTIGCEDMTVGYATDLGRMDTQAGEHLGRSDVLVVESNHDLEMLKRGPYPWHLKQRILSRTGHLSNEALSAYLAEGSRRPLKCVYLAHISEVNNEGELARFCATSALAGSGLGETEVRLTYQDRPTKPYRLRPA